MKDGTASGVAKAGRRPGGLAALVQCCRGPGGIATSSACRWSSACPRSYYRTTINIYGHLIPSVDAALADGLDELLTSASNGKAAIAVLDP